MRHNQTCSGKKTIIHVLIEHLEKKLPTQGILIINRRNIGKKHHNKNITQYYCLHAD